MPTNATCDPVAGCPFEIKKIITMNAKFRALIKIPKSLQSLLAGLELCGWRIVAGLSGFDVLRMSICHLCNARTSGASNDKDAMTPIVSVLMLAVAIRIIPLIKSERSQMTPNEES